VQGGSILVGAQSRHGSQVLSGPGILDGMPDRFEGESQSHLERDSGTEVGLRIHAVLFNFISTGSQMAKLGAPRDVGALKLKERGWRGH
jgi:hypothetical protein